MHKISRELCRYVCVLNVVLTTFFALAGPQSVALLTGISAIVLYAGMMFFDRAIDEGNRRRVVMHNDGSNDVETWKVEEDDEST